MIKTNTIILKVFFLILFTLIFFSGTSFAQGTGSIMGKIVDAVTQEELCGANVVVEGTSLGAATDIEGKYVIRNISVGNHTLRVSYIGYTPKTVDVTIVENRTLEFDVELEYNVIEGEVVTVQGQAKGQLAAINQQLSATGITNIVSAEKIREVPDANAAEAVGRLPGISIKRSSGEGNEVVVRGIQPKFNIVTINNIRMPSTNENNTAVGLAGVSQYLIDGIEVRKTLRAEDDGDVVGGIVNLKLATAPDGLHGDVSLEDMYNGLTDNFGSYRGSVHLSNRFFDNKLGAIGQINIEQAYRPNDALSAGFAADRRTTDNQGTALTNGNFQRNDITRKRFGATVLLDYKLPKGKIQASSIYNKFDEDRWEKNYIANISSGSPGLQKNMRSIYDKTYTLVNNISLETEVFGGVALDVGAAFTSGRRKGYTNAMGFWYDGSLTTPINDKFLTNYWGKTAYDIIPALLDTGANAKNYLLSRLYREDVVFNEHQSTFQANLNIPLTFNRQLSGSVKFGGKMQFKKRKYDYGYDGDTGGIYGGDSDILTAIINDNPQVKWAPFNVTDGKFYAYPMYDGYVNDILGDNHVILQEFASRDMVNQIVEGTKARNWGNLPQWYKTLPGDLASDYSGTEEAFAGYLMADLNWGKLLFLNAGVRYEKENTDYSGYGVYDVPSTVFDELDTLSNVKRSNDYYLPSATLRFNYADWGDIRVAYSKSLARPEYYAFIPHYNADIRKSFSGSTPSGIGNTASGAAGNTHLEPAVSNNFDLIFSFYDNYIGLFSVSGFYKEIDKFFYQANFEVIDFEVDNQYLRDNNYDFAVPKGQYINIWLNLDKTSYLRGVELDWQTNFWYLPFPLNGIVLGVNYTKISSNAQYYTPQKVKVYYGPRPFEFTEERIDSFQTQSLVDQPNDLVNLSVGYDYKDFSMRLAFSFSGKTLSYKTNDIQTDGYSHNYRRLDLSVKQKLPLEGLSVQLLLSNITKTVEKSYTYVEKFDNSQQYYGMTGSIGIRYEY